MIQQFQTIIHMNVCGKIAGFSSVITYCSFIVWSYIHWDIRKLSLHRQCTVKGFHVTSYQANFAGHHTRNHHVGFLFTCDSIGKSNKMFHYFLFSSYHITRLQPNDKNISTYTWMKFQILPWSVSKVLAVFVAFLHTALCNLRKPRDFEKLCACKCVQTFYTCIHVCQFKFEKL